MNQHSTFWALAAVLSVLTVASLSLSTIEDAPVRRPFTSANWSQESVKLIDTPDLISEKESSAEVFDNTEASTSKSLPLTLPQANKFTLEALGKAGMTAIIETVPFEGQLFDFLPLNELISQVPQKQIVSQRVSGFNVKAFEVYAFLDLDPNLSDDIYGLIKSSVASRIELTINQTNAFGLSSFFINFEPPRDNAFLIVKFEDSVYALSYPKSGGITALDFYQILREIL